MAFYFKNTNKDIDMSEEDEEHYKKTKTFRFCVKETIFDKARDPCHLTGKYRGLAL